jgi:hypothetical protein
MEFAEHKMALKVAKRAGSAALTIAKAGVKTFSTVDQRLIKVWVPF